MMRPLEAQLRGAIRGACKDIILTTNSTNRTNGKARKNLKKNVTLACRRKSAWRERMQPVRVSGRKWRGNGGCVWQSIFWFFDALSQSVNGLSALGT